MPLASRLVALATLLPLAFTACGGTPDVTNRNQPINPDNTDYPTSLAEYTLACIAGYLDES